MQVIQHIEVGAGGVAALEFTSIPQTFTDLMLLTSTRSATGGNVDITFFLNSSSSSYNVRYLYGTGSSVGSGSSTTSYAGYTVPSSYTANTFSNCSLYIPNYTSSNNKSWSIDSVIENNATGSFQGINAGLWSNTSAVTSLKFTTTDGSNFAQYTSATLYGVLKGSDGVTTVS